MRLIKLIAILAVPLFLTVSCNDYLDVKPKGIIIAETVSDYESILNDRDIVNPFGMSNSIINASDDLTDKEFSTQNNTSAAVNLYFWREYINNTPDGRPDVWGDLYGSIANLNAVTEGVLSATGGTEQEKKQLFAEAMVDKAFLYFHLLSFFSPAYDKAGAATDYGVPYITSTDVSQPKPVRPSLQESYDQMITDITTAIPDLPETNINKTRVTKDAAYGMLARIYMSMRDYDNAEKYADMVLGSGSAAIVNYNDYIGADLPPSISSPEELWVKYSNNSSFTYSTDLLSHYDLDNDLRTQFFAALQDDGTYSFGATSYNPNRGITYAEIYLDKAEILARKGDVAGALEIVNTQIRQNRFAPDTYTPLTATTEEEAITAVLEERRRELAFKGTRWSDMKRLDAEGRMRPVERIGINGSVLETLEPGSTAYTFQIPLAVQSFNPKMPLNKR